VAVLGGGWPGVKHVEGYRGATGFKVVAVADRIADRRDKLVSAAGGQTGAAGQPNAVRAYESAEELLSDKALQLDVVSVCLPNDLHAATATAALKRGCHVVCEPPPANTAKAAEQMAKAAAKADRILLYAFQRRFGGAEQAARLAVEKGYAGAPYHARAAWTRTRGVPVGTGWYPDTAKSGGGALLDLGVPVLELAWSLLGRPKPAAVFAAAHHRFADLTTGDAEDAGVALIRFENGATLELVASWAMNQPPSQNGTVCRINGDGGAIEVYTPRGPLMYRHFQGNGTAKEQTLTLPKTVGYVAMMRHLKECVAGRAEPVVGPGEGVALMRVVEAIYKSAATGKSVDVKLPEVPVTDHAAVDEAAE